MASLKVNPPRRVHPSPHEKVENLHVKDVIKNPSSQWLMNALDALLSSYSEVLKLLPNPQAQCLSEGECKWVDRWLEDLINLLDSCIELKTRICEVEHYDMLLHKAIRCLDGMELNKEKATSILVDCIGPAKSIGMIHGCRKISTPMVQKFGYLRISPASLFEDMQTLNECTAFVLKTLLKALFLPKKSTSSLIKIDSPVAKCCSLVNRFCHILRSQTASHRCSCCQLYELKMADGALRRLYTLLTDEKTKFDTKQVKESVESLKKWKVELRKGISPLSNKIEELYTALIKARMASLDCLRYSI